MQLEGMKLSRQLIICLPQLGGFLFLISLNFSLNVAQSSFHPLVVNKHWCPLARLGLGAIHLSATNLQRHLITPASSTDGSASQSRHLPPGDRKWTEEVNKLLTKRNKQPDMVLRAHCLKRYSDHHHFTCDELEADIQIQYARCQCLAFIHFRKCASAS
jgi:hypothetical protein